MSLLNGLTDNQLLKDLQILVHRDHTLEAELIAHLGEVDARRLYLEQALPSMFHYCVAVLHFAEGVAYKRIAVARAARRHPELLAALESGDVHLTAASLIAPHLADGKTAEWLALARHKTAHEIRQQIVDRKPKPNVSTSVRRSPTPRPVTEPNNRATRREGRHAAVRELIALPTAVPASTPPPHQSSRRRSPGSAEPSKARCEPLGAERYCVRFVADNETHAQLQELRSLLRFSIPDGDVAKILARAIDALLQQVRRQKIGSCSSPRSARTSTPEFEVVPSDAAKKSSRHIPAAIRREVWKRDGGRCTFLSRKGRQCGSAQFLEFHHQLPWARCREHTPSNIALRCRAHNQYEAELAFGIEHVAQFRKGSAGGPAARDGGDGECRKLIEPGL